MFDRLWHGIDRHLGPHVQRSPRGRVFPNHWSLLLGQLAVWSFVVLVGTGAYLLFFFDASGRQVTYDGSHDPLRGIEMTAAYRSVIRLTFDIQGGLLVRQVHHWAALVFMASIVAHLARVFFTGAFRRPRRGNWVLGVGLLLVSLATGFTGYALPYDLLSGTGLRIASAVLLAVPVVGTWLAFVLFGGEPPDPDVIGRLFALHVLVLPVVLAAMIVAHLALVWRQGPTQFPGGERREQNVVGPPVRSVYAWRSLSLGLAVAAVTTALGGLVQINPLWLYGPYQPAAVTTAAQPDWYLLWVEGALRTFGPWRVDLGDHTLSEVFWPGVALPLLAFGSLFAWPFVHDRLTGEHGDHHLLQRPRDHPVRTAFGVAVLAFFVVLTMAAGQDIIAERLGISIPAVVWTFRSLLVVAPTLAAVVTHRACRGLTSSEPEGSE